MPRFLFQLSEGVRDLGPTEVELETSEHARVVAVQFLAQALADEAARFWDDPDWRLTVTTDDQLALFTIEVVGSALPTLRVLKPRPDFT